MTQSASNCSRALNTAKFLLVSPETFKGHSDDKAENTPTGAQTDIQQQTRPASAPEVKVEEKEIWDAANRQFIKYSEAHIEEPDLACSSPSGNARPPSLRSLLNSLEPSRHSQFNPHTAEDHPAGPDNSTLSSVRASLTGYQWGRSSPTPGESRSHAFSSSADDSGSDAAGRRPRSLDSPQPSPLQCPGVAGTVPAGADAAEGPASSSRQPAKKAMPSRRHSLQLLTPSEQKIQQLYQQSGSRSRTSHDGAVAGTAGGQVSNREPGRNLHGSSRRSLLGALTGAAQANDDAIGTWHGQMPRRSRSLELPPPHLYDSSAEEAATGTPAGGRPTDARATVSLSRSRKQLQHAHGASVLDAVGAAGKAAGAAVSSPSHAGKPHLKLSLHMGAHTSPNTPTRDHPTAASPFAGNSTAHAEHAEQGSETSRFTYKPYVLPLEDIDRRAHAHAAESDCTAYNAIVQSLLSSGQPLPKLS